jgi:hypothetical protein
MPAYPLSYKLTVLRLHQLHKDQPVVKPLFESRQCVFSSKTDLQRTVHHNIFGDTAV